MKRKERKIPRAVCRELYGNNTLYGHKVQRDRTKYKRQRNYKIEVDNE